MKGAGHNNDKSNNPTPQQTLQYLQQASWADTARKQNRGARTTATEETRATASGNMRMTTRGDSKHSKGGHEGYCPLGPYVCFSFSLLLFSFTNYTLFHITRRGKRWWEEHQLKQGKHQCRQGGP
jgi:hypothetical protein